MNVAPGSRLGPYEIVSRIGAGGMGEVWKARDTRLDRSVAIKVLPAEFAQNAQFKIRFEREAKTISQLNHPNICTLYDVGEDYLVMELLEGETLADKIAKGALPLDHALRYGIEIADALDKAHRNGVIHRDLKPANIIITKSRAKLLDFGLAKTSAIVSVDGATIHKPLTQEGTILGTFQYMAPEQLEGEEADARTDIFAFGVLLYEMVTGKRAFEGKTKTSLIASIVSSEPKPISQFQPLTPSALEHVVRKCLAKERDNRWQSAHDIAEELTWISGVGSQEEPITRRESRLLWMALAAAMLVAAASVVSFSLGRSRSPSPGPIRFTFSSPELVAAQNDPEASGFALSQDGKTLAFIGAINGTRHIFLRSLNQFDVRALAGTEGATFPFWSPDGASLGFFAAHKLKTISAGGGEPKTLCDVEFARGGTWSGDGTIVFAANTRSPLYRIAASGGNPVAVTQLDRSASEVSHRWPAFLPDNHHFLFYVMGDRKGTYVGSLDSKERTRVLDGSSNAVYVSPGFLLFASSRALVAQRFDLRRLQVMGDATTSLAEDVGRYGENGPSGYTRFAVSGNGVLAFQRMDSAPTQLIWFNREGKEIGHLGSAGDYGEPRMSPDGSRITVGRTDPKNQKTDVWSADLARGLFSRITDGPGENVCDSWSPDGREIAFSSDRSGAADLYAKSTSGNGPERLLLHSPLSKYLDDWSPDGQTIVYEVIDAKTESDLWTLRLTDKTTVPFLVTQFNETHAKFSPDGKWISYSSDESGTAEVYVQKFPSSGEKWQISAAGGDQAMWSRDGKSLFYVAGNRTLMEAEIAISPSFHVVNTKPLFPLHIKDYDLTLARNLYMPSWDAHSFLVTTTLESTFPPIQIVSNWTADLAQK